MGIYLNPRSKGFQSSLNSEIYVDKTDLLEQTNRVLVRGRSSSVSAVRDGSAKSMGSRYAAGLLQLRRGFSELI